MRSSHHPSLRRRSLCLEHRDIQGLEQAHGCRRPHVDGVEFRIEIRLMAGVVTRPRDYRCSLEPYLQHNTLMLPNHDHHRWPPAHSAKRWRTATRSPR